LPFSGRDRRGAARLMGMTIVAGALVVMLVGQDVLTYLNRPRR
jgi:hypothetical protein